MVKVLRQIQQTKVSASPRILYIGQFAEELRGALGPASAGCSMSFAQSIEFGLALAREQRFGTIIIDQHDGALASKLVLPLLAELGSDVKLVVISALRNVGDYLRVPGAARVISAPLRHAQLLRVLDLELPRPLEQHGQKTGAGSNFWVTKAAPVKLALAAAGKWLKACRPR